MSAFVKASAFSEGLNPQSFCICGSTYPLKLTRSTQAKNVMSLLRLIENPESIVSNTALQEAVSETENIPGQPLYHAYPNASTGFPRSTASSPAVPVLSATACEAWMSENVSVPVGTIRTFGSLAI